MILISSCLAGLVVRYNETHSLNLQLQKLIRENKALPVCPELLAGFSTPREPAEIIGGTGDDVLDGKARVIEKSGRDVTEMYIRGARLTLQKATELNATAVVLKEYSPSCGSAAIYNGEFSGKTIAGDGVTSALLKRNNICVMSEKDYEDNNRK